MTVPPRLIQMSHALLSIEQTKSEFDDDVTLAKHKLVI